MPRRRNFDAKQISDLPLSEQADAARLGLVAVTRGAKLVSKIRLAILLKNETEKRLLLEQVAGAVRTNDHTVLREMANYLESATAGDFQKGGDRGTSLAAHYLLHCKPRIPTAGQVQQHLCDCMGDDAPDRRTVQRIMRRLGH
jgi:ribosomal protein S28E/S33